MIVSHYYIYSIFSKSPTHMYTYMTCTYVHIATNNILSSGMCMYCGLDLGTLLLKKEHGNEHLSIFAIPRLNGCHLGQVSLQRDGDSTLTNQLPDVGCDPITTEGTSE